MGFFDSWSDLVSAATPWSQVEAEAVSGGSSTTSTPAQKDNGGEGEAIVCCTFLNIKSIIVTGSFWKPGVCGGLSCFVRPLGASRESL